DELKTQDRKNRRIGILATLAIQLLLLVLAYLIVAWQAPDPPNEVYGIELGFLSSAAAPGSDQNTEEELESEIVNPEESMDAPEQSESISEPDQATSDEELVEDPENTVAVEEQISTEVEEIEHEEASEKEAVEDETEKQEVEEIKKPEVDERALMGSGSSNENENTTVDERALYGNQGKEGEGNASDGEAASLSMSGWKWDRAPNPNDQSDESGKIVFKITIDPNDGMVLRVSQAYSNVSPKLTAQYRSAVQKLTFSRIGSGQVENTEGVITFIIKTR
ncbi:MAG: hypothetical protein AAF789_05685, partial [Bacteroidota bacterium]